jgi:superfamily II DNA helicase RecQ
MTSQAAGNRQAIATVLERFLCPGGKLRLSPYIEAAQCSVLLGEGPDPRRHAGSLRELLGKPEHADKLDSLVQSLREAPGARFGDAFFARRECIDFYFLHYFPANLGKLQIVLLDLLRYGHLPPKLHLIDLGVGPGTSFLAVLDFVLALGAMADLAGVPLPLEELSLRGHDRSPTSLAYTREVLQVFGRVLEAYGERASRSTGLAAGPALTAAGEIVERALAGAQLQQADIGGTEAIPFDAGSLVVLSYVLNDLDEQGGLEIFEARLAGLGEGSQLIILEPGDQGSAGTLMRWRRSLVQRMPHLQPILPCGQELGPPLPAVCDNCWCARREAIHLAPLQREHLARLDDYLEDWEAERRYLFRRGLERLSWSYCVLASRLHQEWRAPPQVPVGAQRYIGLRRGDRSDGTGVAEEAGMATLASEGRLVAFCPARLELTQVSCHSAVLIQGPGKVLPPLRFGELVVLENVSSHQNGANLHFTMNRTSRVVSEGTEASLPCSDPQPESLNALARRLFGLPALHNFQHKIIRRVLQGRNTLGIAATGAGKTECFLLPAMILPGLTVVVSPLKSLMQDQWERCDERYGLGALTTYINSDVDCPDRAYRLQGLRAGRYKLAYFTPEQLARSSVRAVLQHVHVSVLAIDEAHCVSQWGHDFRPDYLNMVRRLRASWERQPVIVALTATAGERVRRDLCGPSLFDLDNRPVEEGGDVVYHGSNRLEHDLMVRIEPGAAARGRRIVEDLRPFTGGATSGSAIVFLPYTGASRSQPCVEPGECSAAVEAFASHLEQELGERVATYHGQMRDGLQTEEGTFLRTRWRREDSPWGVYIFQRDGETFCAVGDFSGPTPGVTYCMMGCWKDLARYGRQFLFERVWPATAPVPSTPPLGDVTGRDRRAEQRAFMHSQKRIMVATKSFGMGIDKADIRLVIHHSPPGDLLSYAQEVGRAARDGNLGRVILYYTPEQYRTEAGHALTDRLIQENFLAGRYVRESDLRAGIAFLRQCPRRLDVHDAAWGLGRRTYAIFSLSEVELYFNDLTKTPALAGLPRPYEWPPIKERYKVVQLTFEVLFKTVVQTAPGTSTTLLESCQEVFTRLRRPIELDWHGLEDSNAELLREVLQRAKVRREELAALCAEAVTGDLLALARRLGCSVEDTVSFLLEASHLKVVRNLSLGSGLGASGNESCWEVGISPAMLNGDRMDALITAVVCEHQRRREEDYADWDLMLREYVGIEDRGTARRCLRRVLLAFLNTGEDVVDAGCGACSGCCPDGDFLPLAERAGRIITIPPDLWSGLEVVRKAVDALPDIEAVRGMWAFLEHEDGARWRHAVYLNVQRMLREASGSVGATILMIGFLAHRWIEREDHDLHRLFTMLWQKHATLGRGLLQFAEMVAEVRPESVTLSYWRARVAHAEGAAASGRYDSVSGTIPTRAARRMRKGPPPVGATGRPCWPWKVCRES